MAIDPAVAPRNADAMDRWRQAEAPSRGRTLLTGVIATSALVAIVWVGLTASGDGRAMGPIASEQAGLDPGAYRPRVYDASPAPPLALVDQAGRPFVLADLSGRTVLVNFGYSHCPDVCPTTLAIDRQVADALPGQVSVVFVTVDPTRDTPTELGAFLAYFRRDFIGLTGTEAQIRVAAEAWGVTYLRSPSDASGGYSMVHTAGTFVIDPQGRLRFFYPYGTPSAVLGDAVRALDHLSVQQ